MEDRIQDLNQRVSDIDQARFRDNKDLMTKFVDIDERFTAVEQRQKNHSHRLNSEELQRSTVIAHLKTKVDAMVWAWVANTVVLGILVLYLMFGR